MVADCALRMRTSSSLRVALAALVVFLIVVLSKPLIAQPSQSDMDRAGWLMDEGDRAVEAGEYENALTSYQRADAIMNVPTTRLAVAQTLMKLNRLVEARRFAMQVRAMPSMPDEPSAFVLARSDAAAMVVDLEERIPRVTVIVDGLQRERLTVEIDGKRVDEQELRGPIRLDPGSHSVRISGDGKVIKASKFVVDEGAHKRLRFALSRAARDARRSDDSPVPRMSTTAYVGFGVGIAGLGVGAVAGYMTYAKSKELDEACTGTACPPQYSDDLENARRTANIANIGLVVGAAGIGVGLFSLLSSDERPRRARGSSSSATAVGVGVNGLGAELTGTF